MTLSSSDIADGQIMDMEQVFEGFGCDGGNLSPSLSWSGAPEGTNSYVVTAYDPDAPTGSGWWHWALVNLPADVTELPEGAGNSDYDLPGSSFNARNDYSVNAFGGACPPEGNEPHRYIFTVFAMPQDTLPLDETASGALVGYFANNTSLDRVSITARYGR
ncbi:MAG: YbhB/YbcL family Raf kinase inhibitor-like protein [Pseudomonadota bacterium]